MAINISDKNKETADIRYLRSVAGVTLDDLKIIQICVKWKATNQMRKLT